MRLEREREIKARARQFALKAGWSVTPDKTAFITERTHK